MLQRTSSRLFDLDQLRLVLSLVVITLASSLFANARDKDAMQYGAGLVLNVPFAEADVSKIVEEVAQNGIIRGTKEYSKDEYLGGAIPASSSNALPQWTDGGKIFYKVRSHALDPLNFKEGGDVGTVTVRYVVMPQGDKNTVIRVDAVFVEEFRKRSRGSNGSVEAAEFKDIRDRLEALQLMRQEAAEAEKQKQLQANRLEMPAQPFSSSRPFVESPATQPASTAIETQNPAPPEGQSLEERVKELRRQTVRMVKSPGAPLKAAPFRTASTIESLVPGTEVLIVISTPYWYGIETHKGEHGWISRDELEQLP